MFKMYQQKYSFYLQLGIQLHAVEFIYYKYWFIDLLIQNGFWD